MPNDKGQPVPDETKAPDKPATPGSPFVLLMGLVEPLPRWLRIPISVVILTIIAYWAVVPEQYKTQVFSYLFNQPIGTSLFPSVEYETADYKIELNSFGGATWLLSFAFRRLRNEATKLADVIATSGDKPEFRSDAHALDSVRDTYNPPKQPNLSRYVVTLDYIKGTPGYSASSEHQIRYAWWFRWAAGRMGRRSHLASDAKSIREH
jgi:hypothetical protein